MAAAELRRGDLVVVEAGQVVPGDGDVVEGIASVDESAITGESAPVIRESGGDRSAVTGGTRVLSDRIVVRITQEPGASFLDRMIALVEGANRQKTPNEIALNILLAALTIVFLLAVATLQPLAIYSASVQGVGRRARAVIGAGGVTGIVLVSLLVCLIPTTIGALLSAIGIAGMDRLVQRNVLAMSGRAVEAAGDVSTLLLDKTGHHHPGQPAGRRPGHRRPGSTRWRWPRPRSCRAWPTRRPRDVPSSCWPRTATASAPVGPASWRAPRGSPSPRRPGCPGSTCPIHDGRRRRARRSARAPPRPCWPGSASTAGSPTRGSARSSTASAPPAARPLVVAEQRGDEPARALGVIHLKDVVKPGMRERFDEMRRMGIRTVMITGDNPMTATGDRRGGRRRRLPRRGHARGQDGADQGRAVRRPARRDDR